jgi:hypothetical protein
MGHKVRYAIVKEEHTIKKKILPQNTVFSAEQTEKVIIMDFLSTIMATKSRTLMKNPKTQTIRKMLDQEGLRITVLWDPSHKGRPGN